MPPTYRYWRTNGNLYTNGPGIEILHDDDAHYAVNERTGRPIALDFPAEFSGVVRNNLNYIYRTTAGQTLLNYLVAPRQLIRIIPGLRGNSAQFSDQDHVKPAALELHALAPGAATRTAVRAMINNQAFLLGSALIARAIRTTPMWDLNSRPEQTGIATMSWADIFLQGRITSYVQNLRDRFYQRLWGWDTNEGYFEEDLRISGRRGIPTRGIYITRDEVQEWLIGRLSLPHRLSTAEKNHIANVTIATLYPHTAAGIGGTCGISWRHQTNYAMNALRPPAIGLAHELIHAYYGTQGLNPGLHDAAPTVTLFEYLCVGLGPFEDYPVTENSIRAEWATVIGHVPVLDTQNRRVPGRRVSYN